MNIQITLETEKDYYAAETMTREAFWDLFKPGCDEHLLLHQLRKTPAFIPELAYVAYDGELLVGNIIYTHAVVSDGINQTKVLCMGPLSVLPSYQNKGIGSALLQKTIELARQMGHRGIVIFGHPEYYKKFGFKDAKEFNIQTSHGDNFDAFMALELIENGLQGISGRFYEDEAFKIEAAALEEYEKLFPFKEKHKREGQFEPK